MDAVAYVRAAHAEGGIIGTDLVRPLDDTWRIATSDSPIPYRPPLEDAFLPGPDRIVREVLARA